MDSDGDAVAEASETDEEYVYEEEDDGTDDVVLADALDADVAACRAAFGDGSVVAITRVRGLVRLVLVVDARDLLGEETRRAWGVSGPLEACLTFSGGIESYVARRLESARVACRAPGAEPAGGASCATASRAASRAAPRTEAGELPSAATRKPTPTHPSSS